MSVAIAIANAVGSVITAFDFDAASKIVLGAGAIVTASWIFLKRETQTAVNIAVAAVKKDFAIVQRDLEEEVDEIRRAFRLMQDGVSNGNRMVRSAMVRIAQLDMTEKHEILDLLDRAIEATAHISEMKLSHREKEKTDRGEK